MWIKDLIKQIFHLVDEEDYNEIIKIDDDHIRKLKDVSYKLDIYVNFEKQFPEIIKNNKADLMDIKSSKNGELLYICHKPKEKLIFLLSPYIVDNACGRKVGGFPHIEYKFNDDIIKIEELHTNRGIQDTQSGLCLFEDRGYGRVLLYALVDLAIRSGYDNQSMVIGMLSFVDADTEKKKKRRNSFYHNRGFEVLPNLDAANGKISAKIQDLIDSRDIV